MMLPQRHRQGQERVDQKADIVVYTDHTTGVGQNWA